MRIMRCLEKDENLTREGASKQLEKYDVKKEAFITYHTTHGVLSPAVK